MFIQPTMSQEELDKLSKRHITLTALDLRFTKEERKKIRELVKADDDDVVDIVELQKKAGYIDLDDPLTIGSVQLFHSKGIMTEERMNEILNAPVEDRERP